MKKMSKFTLYWLDGTMSIVEGKTISEAMNNAGYGGGSLRALDTYTEGDVPEYEYVYGKWIRKVQ